jgi:hypothetical protein
MFETTIRWSTIACYYSMNLFLYLGIDLLFNKKKFTIFGVHCNYSIKVFIIHLNLSCTVIFFDFILYAKEGNNFLLFSVFVQIIASLFFRFLSR